MDDSFFEVDLRDWVQIMAALQTAGPPLPEGVCKMDLRYWLAQVALWEATGGREGVARVPSRRKLASRWNRGERWTRTRCERWLATEAGSCP